MDIIQKNELQMVSPKKKESEQVNTIRKDESILISLKVRLELFGIPTKVVMDIEASVSLIDLHVLQDLERRMGKTIPLEEWQKE